MFKLTVVLLAALFIATTQGFPAPPIGGYTDRPELLEDPRVVSLTMFAAEYMALTQNIILNRVKVIGVQTQVVAGVNYKIDFAGEPVSGIITERITCHALIYVKFDSTKQIQEVKCSA